jgi:hypothetical protein
VDDITKRRLVATLTRELVDALDETMLAALRELAEVNNALHEAGIDYPTGARGVTDLASQRDSAERSEQDLAELISAFRTIARDWIGLHESDHRRACGTSDFEYCTNSICEARLSRHEPVLALLAKHAEDGST